MTRDEALNILYNASVYHPNYLDALNMAINTLEQQPSGDAVNKQVVLDMLEDINAETNGVGFYYKHYVEYIKNLSSVIPQQKMGRWIIIDDCEKFIAKCSECGCIEDSRMIKKYPYCHCGAKMQEVEE